MTLRILAIGDVVGHAGLSHLQATLHAQKMALGVDLCIVNGENACEIKGICASDAQDLLYAGADVITLG
ncbi:MAG: YmdB family metallophosphoesterase, partial [Clostridia bacterium]|nr:YmdB family metallophosphoesterase [Clostridia bacterium]